MDALRDRWLDGALVDDTAGFAAFVAARYRALVRTAFLLLGDRGLAEDLVQSALFTTFGAWKRLQASEAAEAYTRTSMVRLAGRWSRRRWRGELPGLEDDGRWTDAADVGGALDVRAALAALPWPQRATLVLRYFDDLTETEVAEVMGCSVGTVKSRASRGLSALRGSGLLQAAVEGDTRRG